MWETKFQPSTQAIKDIIKYSQQINKTFSQITEWLKESLWSHSNSPPYVYSQVFRAKTSSTTEIGKLERGFVILLMLSEPIPNSEQNRNQIVRNKHIFKVAHFTFFSNFVCWWCFLCVCRYFTFKTDLRHCPICCISSFVFFKTFWPTLKLNLH